MPVVDCAHSQRLKSLHLWVIGAENRGMSTACLTPTLNTSAIITKLADVKEARALPRGSLVGDLHGGLTFTDAVAAALELRSSGGWHEVQTPDSQMWTIIALDR